MRACVYAMGGAMERAPDWLGRRARAVTSRPGSYVRIASEARSRPLRYGGGRSRVFLGLWPGGT